MTKKGLDRMQVATRCTARRRNGEPCLNYAIKGAAVCRMHGGSAPQVRAAAQVRILEASDKAAAKLVRMMQDPKVPHAVQLAAAKDLLDRANIVGTQQVAIEVTEPEWQRHMAEVIVQYSPEDVVDAEVVEEPDPEAKHDEALRRLEQRRLRRRKRGQPPAKPSER